MFLRPHLSCSYQRIHINQVAKAECERSRNRRDQHGTDLLCILIRARWHSSTLSVMHWPSSQRPANCKLSHLKVGKAMKHMPETSQYFEIKAPLFYRSSLGRSSWISMQMSDFLSSTFHLGASGFPFCTAPAALMPKAYSSIARV